MQSIEEVKIITEEYCIGCGICTLNNYSDIFMDRCGKYQVNPKIANETLAKKFLELCPFSSKAMNEDYLSEELFNDGAMIKNDIIGYSINNFIGHTTDSDLRVNASSGGIISWMLLKLLDEKKVTHAIHVGKSNSPGTLFEYTVSKSRKEILAGASSKYYPIEASSVLSFIKGTPGKYVVVALPCFAKGIRLLQKSESIFKEKIKYIISPVCGHLKTKNYTKFLAWQSNISFNSLVGMNFRKKIPGFPASQYGTEFTWTKNGKRITIVVQNIVCLKWLQTGGRECLNILPAIIAMI